MLSKIKDFFYSCYAVGIGLAINMGLLSGYSTIDKFGLNSLITTATDPEDVWEGGGVYPFSNTADIVSLSSSDVDDDQDIMIIGLDADGNEKIQTITLNGQTRVALDTALLRVYRMSNESDTNLEGTVYCYSGTANTAGVPSGASVEKARITNGNNQTLMAIYTIPKGKVGFLLRGEVGLEFTGAIGSGVNFARIAYKSRRSGKVFKIKKVISLLTYGDSNYVDKRSFPDIIPSLTDIKINVMEVSDDMGVWSTFDIMLVDEKKFGNGYLTYIGQPGY